MKNRGIAGILTVAGIATMLICITPNTAAASYVGTPYEGERPALFELHVGMAYADIGMAAGGRWGIPLVDNGFIRSINNAVYLSFGADFFLVRYRDEAHGALGIPLALHWEFYFSDRWSAYGEAGVNIYFHPSLFQHDGWTAAPENWISGSVGGRFHITPKVALTLHAGTPYSSFGVLFSF